MYNWSVDTKTLAKDRTQHTMWRLEQLVNFGLGTHEKLNTRLLKKYWPKLHLDPKKKNYLSWLLWPKKRS